MSASIPPDGPVRIGDVQLPAGRQLEGQEPRPLLWATSMPVPDAGRVWLRLHEMHGDTGLAPILLGFLAGRASEGRPWDAQELEVDASVRDIDRLDPAMVLAGSWAGSLDPDDDSPEQQSQFAPYTMHFPGLALGGGAELTAGELGRALSLLPATARIGLVPAERPADVLVRVGFTGAVNSYGTAAPLSAVLRSWEDRFGATLVEVGFAEYRLLVRRPPRTQAAAEAAAAEIWAMCDEFWPTPHGVARTTVSEIAEYILDAPLWTLWLD
ncbi:MAG TPA: DUF4253 domain-containing protein [Streptosporangiaceae bacterium]|nr:DUF4253 domain-containing protein [Streptosporangiaceae bacterium]